MMIEWLKLLPLELKEVEVSKQPNDEPVADTEVVVDYEVPDELKRIWTFARALAKEAAEIALQSEFTDDSTKESRAELRCRAMELKRKAEIVKDLFWIGINKGANVWEVDSIGIRRDWKVVTKVKRNDDIPPFLKRLMGDD